jgi:anti-sigma regulatory factor (Ser/Thr protein kinase)
MIVARPLQVREPGETARARRAAAAAARALGFDEHDQGRAALVATEAATNLIRHAGGGELLLACPDGDGPRNLQIFSIDQGPGFVEQVARRDGYSTAGGTGTGLGAIARASDRFDIYSQPAGGTVLLSEIGSRSAPAPAPSRFHVGGFSVPKPGEEVCGDGWAVREDRDGLALLLLDGLGHGPGAAEATRAGIEGFVGEPGLAPAAQITRLHERLRPTRGAAAAVVRVDAHKGELSFAGVGNTQGFLDGGDRVRHLVPNNGTLGHEVLRVRQSSYPWPVAGILVLATDGLTTRLGLSAYPGLRRHTPEVAAAVLYRDFRRGHDDATVLVAVEAR